jgi:hypothetical protein
LNIPVVINGKAVVRHDKASNVKTNYQKEVAGYALNEDMWDQVNDVLLKEGGTIIHNYLWLSRQMYPEWFNTAQIGKAQLEWLQQFK